MIFTKEHIEKIKSGQKTVTRRIWKKPHVKVGGIYGVRSDRFKPVAEDAPRIKVTSISVGKLGNIVLDPNEVKAEGMDSTEDFIRIWTDLHHTFDPFQDVYRIQFELVGDEQ